MPQNTSNRRGTYVRNETKSGTLVHGQPVYEAKGGGYFVGQAIKQKAPAWTEGLTTQNVIADDEYYYVVTKGEVQIAAASTFVKGDSVYISTDGNSTLTETSGASKVKYGVVTEGAKSPAGNTGTQGLHQGDLRGAPSGYIRVDLDLKDTLA